MQNEGVIGDHDVGVASGAHRTFDKAALIMRAGGIDTFAAPIREAQGGGG